MGYSTPHDVIESNPRATQALLYILLDPDPTPEYTEEDAAILFGIRPPPPPHVQRLALPVVLPQIRTSYEAPFARGYNPELAVSGVEQVDLLAFIDGLKIAIAANPPLRIVDAAGMIISMVLLAWTLRKQLQKVLSSRNELARLWRTLF